LELKAKHSEILSELINIGYGRAAAALSDLTGQRITLEAPKVDLHPIHLVQQALSKLLHGEVSSVHQVFTGPVAGHALLLVDSEAAELLTEQLINKDTPIGNKRAARREALTEVGNILLQASMGVCGNLLQVHVTFSVPRLHVESIEELLNSVTVAERELQFALLVQTRFQLLQGQVSGYLLVILGITSFSRLLDELENWERREVSASKPVG
jgi:chemotaxis protein CheC